MIGLPVWRAKDGYSLDHLIPAGVLDPYRWNSAVCHKNLLYLLFRH